MVMIMPSASLKGGQDFVNKKRYAQRRYVTPPMDVPIVESSEDKQTRRRQIPTSSALKYIRRPYFMQDDSSSSLSSSTGSSPGSVNIIVSVIN